MQFDYESIKTALESNLSLLSNWAKVLFYGVYSRLTSAVAYITEKLAYLAEVYYRESNWTSAQNIKSLTMQAEFLNYAPSRKIGAVGEVLVSYDEFWGEPDGFAQYTGDNILIPKWTQMSDEDNEIFVYTTEDAIVYTGTSGTIGVAVKEGVVKTYTYEAEGNVNETVTLVSDSIEEEVIQVDIVDATGDVLAPVRICGEDDYSEKLYFLNDVTNYYCEVKSSPTFERVEIKFGDGIYGRQLQAGEFVKVTYAETLGDEGNITQTDIIEKVQDTIYNDQEEEVTIYVRNDEEISNGNAIEDIEHIRNYGNRLFVSGYRCGGADDWKTILESNPLIYKAQVANYEDIAVTGYDNVNKVFVTAVSSDGSTLTTAQKAQVVLDVKDENKKGVTEVISWYDPEIIFLLFKIDAKVTNNPFTVITANIKSELIEEYGILNVEFQTNVYQSNYINFIDDNTYIRYHTTDVLQMEKGMISNELLHTLAVSYTTLDTADPEEQIYLQPDTLEIWLFRKQNGVWDDTPYKIGEDVSGTIVGLAGDLPVGTYTITNSIVDYALNQIGYKIDTIVNNPIDYGIRDPGDNDLTGYLLSIAYKTQDGNGEQLEHIRLPRSKFITNVDEDYVFVDLEYV